MGSLASIAGSSLRRRLVVEQQTEAHVLGGHEPVRVRLVRHDERGVGQCPGGDRLGIGRLRGRVAAHVAVEHAALAQAHPVAVEVLADDVGEDGWCYRL